MSDDTEIDRRGLAKAAGVASGITGLAGCGSNTDDTDPQTDEPEPTETSDDEQEPEQGTDEISFTLNGDGFSTETAGDVPLLYVLRNEAGLKGPKFGCGLDQCGACNVEVDGSTIRSCVTPIDDVDGSEVLTTSGLGTDGDYHEIQQAFIDEQAAQCGYCISGMIMKSKELLDENSDPSDTEIREHLDGQLCRCGTHSRIVSAVSEAADRMGD